MLLLYTTQQIMTGFQEIEDQHQQLERSGNRIVTNTFPEKVQDIILITPQEMVGLTCTERQTCMHTNCNLTDWLP